MNTTAKLRVFPIRFSRLFPGSDFTIFAEPSRDIRKSEDPTVYTKTCEAYSVAKDENGNPAVPERAIILYPEDLVVPRNRGN